MFVQGVVGILHSYILFHSTLHSLCFCVCCSGVWEILLLFKTLFSHNVCVYFSTFPIYFSPLFIFLVCLSDHILSLSNYNMTRVENFRLYFSFKIQFEQNSVMSRIMFEMNEIEEQLLYRALFIPCEWKTLRKSWTFGNAWWKGARNINTRVPKIIGCLSIDIALMIIIIDREKSIAARY